MYVPPPFRVDDEAELQRFIAEHPFGTLVTTMQGSPCATHLPFLVERVDAQIVLRAHMARANPHWSSIEGAQALVAFLGPHAYISPRWYESRDNVPTWNYIAVHAYGVPRLTEDRERTLDLLAALSRRHEAGAQNPWALHELSSERLESFLAAIVAFEVPVTRFEAAYKLSQNRTTGDRRGAIAALRADGRGALADAMERA